MNTYIKLDESNAVVSIQHSENEINSDELIRLSKQDPASVSIGWRRIDGQWLPPLPPEDASVAGPTQQDIFNGMLMLNLIRSASPQGIAPMAALWTGEPLNETEQNRVRLIRSWKEYNIWSESEIYEALSKGAFTQEMYDEIMK